MIIGNLDLRGKLILAPMAEITDSSFRKICKEQGAVLTFTQMVSAQGVVRNDFDTLRLFSFHRSEKPIGVQVLGNDPDILGEAVRELSNYNPDLIDLNCGCPVEKVVKNNFGAALIDDPKRIGRIVRKMVDSSNGIPISVKTRLGKDRNNINIIDIAKTVEDNGGSLFIVHARTRADKYETETDYDWIRKVKECVSIPIVGNGSLFSPKDIDRIFNETGCDAALVARGAIGNPFIFWRYNEFVKTGNDPGEPEITIVKDVLLKLLKHLEEEFGELTSLNKAKKHVIWFYKNYPGIDLLMDEVFSQTNLKDLRSVIESHTNKIINNFYKQNLSVEIDTMFKKKVLFWLTEDRGG